MTILYLHINNYSYFRSLLILLAKKLRKIRSDYLFIDLFLFSA